MARRPIPNVLLAIVWVLAGCVASPPSSPDVAPSGVPPSAPSRSESLAPSLASAMYPSVEPSIAPSEQPTLPAALRELAWVRLVPELNAAGNLVAERISIGLLGSAALIEETRPASGAFFFGVAAGPFVALVSPAADGVGTATIEIRDARDSSTVATLRRSMLGTVFLDPIRRLLYAAIRHQSGGIDIERISFDGHTSTTLVRLGPTFTPGGIPEDRYDLTLTQSGALVVTACDRVVGCRLWHIGPGTTSAAPPIAFASSKPGLCWLGAASDKLAVVFDADSCTDNGDAPRPSHAVSLEDGTATALPARTGISIRRVVSIGGRSIGIVTQPAGSGGFAVGTIDLTSQDEATLILNVPISADTGWPAIVPSTGILPGSWILLEPFAPDSGTTIAPPPAALLDARSGASIVLPDGTSGWQWY